VSLTMDRSLIPPTVVASSFEITEPTTEDAPTESYRGVRYTDFMVDRWVKEALKHVRTRMLEEGSWVADVAGIDGAWGDGETEEDAVGVLAVVLSDWAYLKIEENDQDIPVLTGIDLNQL
jgi:predicted RNase H-like HicB family nuclease